VVTGDEAEIEGDEEAEDGDEDDKPSRFRVMAKGYKHVRRSFRRGYEMNEEERRALTMRSAITMILRMYDPATLVM
jgi:hypothetical protein